MGGYCMTAAFDYNTYLGLCRQPIFGLCRQAIFGLCMGIVSIPDRV